ncbi:MAG: VCBS repeat-containing protein [Planctomycetota bacterium]
MPGWPVQIATHPNFHPNRNVTLADLDGDGRLEIIRPSTDGRVYVFRYDGTALPGWPRTVSGWGQISPVVADLDGDGFLEILVATRGITSGGSLHALDRGGNPLPGWPLTFSNNNVEAVVAEDLDGDGRLEVIATERAYPIGRAHVLRADGTPLPGWPLTLDHVPAFTPAVGDLDGDGRKELVFGSYTSVYVTDAAGQVRAGWPVNVASTFNANVSYQSPALADLDADGVLEIAMCLHQSGGGCYVFKADGTQLAGWPKLFGGWSYCPPTVADLDGDGSLDVLAGRAGGTAAAPALYAWDRQGQLLPGFPYVTEGGAESPVTVANVDLDPELEIFFGTSVMANNQGFLHCIDAHGQIEPGFPLRTDGFTYLNGATIADVDGDGVLEIAALANRDTTGTLYLWKLTGPTSPGRILWSCYHEGNLRTGLTASSDRLAVRGHATPGGTLRLELQGAVGNAMAAFLGAQPAVVPWPPAGILRLDPLSPIVFLYGGPLATDGRLLGTLPIPGVAALRGLRLPIQGVEAGATVGLALRQMQMVVVQ